MKLSKLTSGNIFNLTHYARFSFFVVLISACSRSSDIAVQSMKMDLPADQQSFSEELLSGELTDLKITHKAIVGPAMQKFVFSEQNTDMFIFIKGNGQLKADSIKFDVCPESIAIPIASDSFSLEIPDGEVLHFVRFSKQLTTSDQEDIKKFNLDNKYQVFFRRFSECEPYTEKIKSPNTVSRTVLPADIIPRVSLGTVEVPGPDEVGAHEHPMLEQLFLGLAGNDITVHAGDKSVGLKEYSILHIPLGSSHWAEVVGNKKMYYMWMDFFITKEGQEWLKTHKPVSTGKNKK
ncbi:MAG: hypothetical protein JXB24_09515 [Bacteroidales bacterium]|nr:hypothetical protein [Bacteroidales bacterium]